MFVGFDDDTEHLGGLQALLINQSLTDTKQLRERMLHNLIKLLPLFSSLVAINTADGQKALQSGVDGVCIIGTKKLNSKVEEPRPFLREIVLQDFLEKGNKLSANIGRG